MAEMLSKKYSLISVPNEPVFRIANLLRGKNVFRLGNDPEHLQNLTKKDFRILLKKNFKKVAIRTVLVWNVALCEKGC